MLCRSLFVLLYFFFWPLCCLFFFSLWILITSLVSSNFYCNYIFFNSGIVAILLHAFVNNSILFFILLFPYISLDETANFLRVYTSIIPFCQSLFIHPCIVSYHAISFFTKISNTYEITLEICIQ
jgi:hypothetical protein